MWNMQLFDVDGGIFNWVYIDSRTGKIDKELIVSVSEPVSPDMNGVSVVPNPVSTSFTISGIEGATSVKIVNSLGMEVGLSNSSVVDVSHLASGMYFVSIRTAKGAVVKPMMISH
jgi:hypothetical protein